MNSCQELWTLFRKILGSTVSSSTLPSGGSTSNALEQLLSKAPDLLKTFYQAMVVTADDDSELAIKKPRFVYWLIRRLLLIWNLHPAQRQENTAVQETIIKILEFRDASFCKDVICDYISHLQELLSASNKFYEDTVERVSLKPFGKQFQVDKNDDEKDEISALMDVQIIFDDPDSIEFIQVRLTELLAMSAKSIISVAPCQLSKLWTILSSQIELGDPNLKFHSVSLAAELLKHAGMPKSINVMSQFIRIFVPLVQFLLREEYTPSDLEEGANFCDVISVCFEQLTVGRSKSLEDKLVAFQFVVLWRKIMAEEALIKGLSKYECVWSSLVFIIRMQHFENLSGNTISDFIFDKTECLNKNVVAVLSAVIAEQISESEGWKNKQIKMENRTQQTVFESNFCAEGSSQVWQKLVGEMKVFLSQNQSSKSFVFEVTQVAKNVLAKLQESENFLVEIDFFGKVIVTDIVQTLIDHSIKKPSMDFVDILDNLLFVQPRDTFTQSVLNQIVALLSLPWMSGEVKLADLRIGETLSFNLINASNSYCVTTDGRPKCLFLLCGIMKVVAPKWRMWVIRKAWSEGGPSAEAVIESLPLFLHHFGVVGHPLAEELITQAVDIQVDEVILKLAANSGLLVCSLGCKTQLKRVGTQEVVFCPFCIKNINQFEEIQVVTSQPPAVPLEKVNPFLKLIGHSDSKVSLKILSLIKPLSVHVGINLATAGLWLNYLGGDREELTLGLAEHIQHLLRPTVDKDNWNDVCQSVVSSLKDASARVISEDKFPYKEAVCKALVNLANFNCPPVDKDIFCILLDLLLTNTCHISVFCAAQDSISVFREKIGVYKSVVTTKLAEKMCSGNPKETLDSLMALFKNANVERFLNKQAHNLLPHMVLYSARANLTGPTSPLEYVSDQLQQKCKNLLASHFHFIYPHIVVHSKNTAEYQKCCQFFERESKMDVKQILPSNRQKVIAELMLQFHSYKSRVINALQILAKSDEDFMGKQPKQKGAASMDIATFILPRFLGILGYFDTLLINSYVTLDKKRDILKSLADIIRFMGPKNVATVKHKILTILNTAYQLKEMEDFEEVLNCWDAFTRTIDISLVGPILAQILANLMLLFDASPSNVVAILKYLIIDNRAALKSAFNCLNFLPEYPRLAAINDAIREESNMNRTPEVRFVLEVMANSISESENVEVKSQTLSKLLKILRCNQLQLQTLIVQNDQVDPIVSNLIYILVSCAREKNHYIAQMAGKCLGSIGAVDPGRLQYQSDLNVMSDICLSVTEDNFAFELINNLVRAYLATTESNDGDACAFSIQEVLKAYSITGNDKVTSVGWVVWNKLTDATRELLQPLLVSLYSKFDRTIQYTTPIIMSKNGQTYHDWLANWSCHLISKVKSTEVSNIFVACKVTIRKDIQCAQFLIPYITTYALCDGAEEDRLEVLKEFEAVLKMSSVQDTSGLSSLALDSAKHESSGHDLKWLASQTLFSILDHMNKWLRKKYLTITAKMRRTEDPELIISKDKDYTLIKSFVGSIPQVSLARASYGCEGYARALMHFESHLWANQDELESCLPELQKVYGALEEPDYVAGVAAVRMKKPTLEEMIHQHTIMANFQDALACYESLGRQCDGSFVECGILNCYLQIDQPHTASILVKGLLNKRPEMTDNLKKYQIEAAWQLGHWEDLSEMDYAGHESCWSTSLGSIFHSLQKKNLTELGQCLEKSRLNQTIRFAAAAMEQGSYPRCYENVVRLQILDEVETLSNAVLKSKTGNNDNESLESLDALFSQWKSRISFSLYSLSNQEPVLRVRRALFSLMLELIPGSSTGLREKLRSELSQCWLLSAKVSRKADQYNKAYRLLLESQKFQHKESFIERAKLLWARDNQGEAISVLKNGIEEQFPGYGRGVEKRKESATPLTIEDLAICGKAKLLLAQYVDDSATIEAEEVSTYYNEAKAVLGNSEDGFYYTATFFDKIVGKNYDETDLDKKGDVTNHIITQYARSLLYGSKHLHQSLPRMLSLWFDFGSRVYENEQAKVKPKNISVVEMTKTLKKMNDLMGKFVEKCPPYIFLSAFPQLTSRICHSHMDVWSILRNIIIKTFIKYPNHVFWHMVALSKSSYQTRAARSKEIFDHVKARFPPLAKLIDGGLKLGDLLVKLSDEKVNYGNTPLRQVSPGLLKMVMSGEVNQLMIPTTQNLTMMLPTVDGEQNEKHNPFPGGLVYIACIKDEVTVMRSLVQPKKVTFIGSDGKDYNFLCKPKDDLRRDCRLVDFNTLLNKLFMRDPQSRKRDLHIRTYTVIPLNETTGVIEWINNLQSLRPILLKLYKEKLGKNMMRLEEIRDHFQTSEVDVAKNKRNFETLLKRHPPIFADWFVQNFPDPQAWYMARLAYTRTTAVMSMVGYLLGLGDRHGENILFDACNGDTVHVDLNCLFNKGRELKIPEVVPFRLTQNMIQGMGPTGYEGPFRIACEVALGLMRKQKDILMSSLRPFVFDPLVDWVPNGKHKKTDSGEIVNEKAIETLRSIENRLNGLIESFGKKKSGSRSTIDIPLSIPGQVQHLIKEASAFDNLSQMYMGWAPYL